MTAVAQSICKRGKTLQMIAPKFLPVGNRPIKQQKKNVNELLIKHFGKDWLSKSEEYKLNFHKDIINSVTDNNGTDKVNGL